ncbi:hypothetical protein D3C79_539720 [compost metagenome]
MLAKPQVGQVRRQRQQGGQQPGQRPVAHGQKKSARQQHTRHAVHQATGRQRRGHCRCQCQQARRAGAMVQPPGDQQPQRQSRHDIKRRRRAIEPAKRPLRQQRENHQPSHIPDIAGAKHLPGHAACNVGGYRQAEPGKRQAANDKQPVLGRPDKAQVIGDHGDDCQPLEQVQATVARGCWLFGHVHPGRTCAAFDNATPGCPSPAVCRLGWQKVANIDYCICIQ